MDEINGSAATSNFVFRSCQLPLDYDLSSLSLDYEPLEIETNKLLLYLEFKQILHILVVSCGLVAMPEFNLNCQFGKISRKGKFMWQRGISF